MNDQGILLPLLKLYLWFLVFHPQECQLGRINFTVFFRWVVSICANAALTLDWLTPCLSRSSGRCQANVPFLIPAPQKSLFQSQDLIRTLSQVGRWKRRCPAPTFSKGGWLRPRPFKIARGPGLLLNHHLRWPTGGKGGYIFPSSFSEAKGTANPPNLSHETTSWCNRDRFQSCGKRPTQRGFNGAIDTYTFRGKCPIIMGFFALFFGISQGGLHSPLYNKAGYGYFLQGGSVFFFFLGGGVP